MTPSTTRAAIQNISSIKDNNSVTSYLTRNNGELDYLTTSVLGEHAFTNYFNNNYNNCYTGDTPNNCVEFSNFGVFCTTQSTDSQTTVSMLNAVYSVSDQGIYAAPIDNPYKIYPDTTVSSLYYWLLTKNGTSITIYHVKPTATNPLANMETICTIVGPQYCYAASLIQSYSQSTESYMTLTFHQGYRSASSKPAAGFSLFSINVTAKTYISYAVSPVSYSGFKMRPGPIVGDVKNNIARLYSIVLAVPDSYNNDNWQYNLDYYEINLSNGAKVTAKTLVKKEYTMNLSTASYVAVHAFDATYLVTVMLNKLVANKVSNGTVYNTWEIDFENYTKNTPKLVKMHTPTLTIALFGGAGGGGNNFITLTNNGFKKIVHTFSNMGTIAAFKENIIYQHAVSKNLAICTNLLNNNTMVVPISGHEVLSTFFSKWIITSDITEDTKNLGVSRIYTTVRKTFREA